MGAGDIELDSWKFHDTRVARSKEQSLVRIALFLLGYHVVLAVKAVVLRLAGPFNGWAMRISLPPAFMIGAR